MTEIEWTERAGSKINLGLKILGKRLDGYHDILSVVQGIDLADTLHFKTAQHSSMTCTDPNIPCNRDNVLRAMALFSQRASSVSHWSTWKARSRGCRFGW